MLTDDSLPLSVASAVNRSTTRPPALRSPAAWDIVDVADRPARPRIHVADERVRIDPVGKRAVDLRPDRGEPAPTVPDIIIEVVRANPQDGVPLPPRHLIRDQPVDGRGRFLAAKPLGRDGLAWPLATQLRRHVHWNTADRRLARTFGQAAAPYRRRARVNDVNRGGAGRQHF